MFNSLFSPSLQHVHHISSVYSQKALSFSQLIYLISISLSNLLTRSPSFLFLLAFPNSPSHFYILCTHCQTFSLYKVEQLGWVELKSVAKQDRMLRERERERRTSGLEQLLVLLPTRDPNKCLGYSSHNFPISLSLSLICGDPLPSNIT